MLNILRAIIIWTLQAILTIVGVILGLLIVPIALLFPDDSFRDDTYILNSDGEEYWLRQLPKWAKWWNNPIDGSLGDDNFRWASRDIPFGLKNTSFLGQFWWMAIRNPFNYFKRFILGCDVRKNKIEKLGGQDYVRDDLESTGWQFLKCGHFYTFYGVWQYGDNDRAFVIQLGNKFDLEDNSKSYPIEEFYKYSKGFTTEINPYKSIGDE